MQKVKENIKLYIATSLPVSNLQQLPVSLVSTLFLIACFLFPNTSSFGQIQDSVQANKQLKEAQIRLDSLDYTTAIQLSQEVLAFYENSIENTAKIGVAYALLGDAHREQGQYDEALKNYQTAKDNFLQFYGAQHATLAQANNDLGLCYWKKGAIQEAIEFFEMALKERIALFGAQHPKVADSYNNLGNCAFDRRDLNNARSYYEQALDIRLTLLDPNDPDIASSYNNLGSCYRFAGQYETAIDYYTKSIKIRELKLGETHPKVAQSCANLGQCYEQMANLEEAIAYYSRSLRICQEHYQENHPDIANAYIGLGGCYSKKGNHSLALKYFEKALAIQKVNFAADSPNLISVYNNLANAYKNSGDYNKAMLFYQNNIGILNKSLGPEHPFTAATYNNMGLIQVALVDFDQALANYRKALSIYEKQGNPQRLASTWNNIGTCLRQQKRFPQAIQAYQQSINLFNKINGGNAASTASAYYNIGNCLGEEEDYETALEYYTQATNLIRSNYGENNPRLAIYKTSIGTIYHKQRKYQAAIQQFDEALSLFNVAITEEASYLESPIEVLNLLNAKTKTLYKLNTPATLEEALEITDFSIQVIANLRQQIQEEYSKRKLSETAHETFHLGISTCHQLHQQTGKQALLEKAFTYSEKSRSNLILSALINQQAASFANIPDSLLNLENQLKTSIATLEKQQRANLKQKATATISDQSTSTLFEKKQAYNQLIQQFESDYPAYYQLKYDDYTIPIAEVQSKLSAEEALIEYFVTDTAVYIFLVKESELQLQEIVVDSLVKEVKLFREGITRYYMDVDAQSEDGYRYLLIQYFKTAYFLYQKLLEPIQKELPTKLTIVNGGILNYIPFDALVSSLPEGEIHRLRDIDYLIKDYEINYAYSATLLYNDQSKNNVDKPTKKLLAFAPVFSIPNRLQLAPLAHNIPEVELIQTFIPDSELFLSTAATKQNFLARASDFQILHLATHGQSNIDLGDFSFLAFSDSKELAADGAFLYAKEIYNLSLSANLVVLSACETAKGELLQGEGVVSLASAFFYAGAKSIVTTLWSINDASTKTVMGSFYQHLQTGATKGQALRQAKLEYITQADDPNPFFWAAFTLTGDTEQVPDTSLSIGWSALYFLLSVFGLLLLVFLGERLTGGS